MTPTDTTPTDTLEKAQARLRVVVIATFEALLRARGPRGTAHDIAEVCLDVCQYRLLPPLLEAIERFDDARWADTTEAQLRAMEATEKMHAAVEGDPAYLQEPSEGEPIRFHEEKP
jgi:hypothetical protein